MSPRHCAATNALRNWCFNRRAGQSHKDNARCTAVEEQPEAKLLQPSSTSLHMISSGLTWGSSSTSLLLTSLGTLGKLYVHRNRRLIRDGSRGRPPRLSHSSELWGLGTNETVEAGIAQWLERRTRDWKVAGSNACWSGGRILFSRIDFLCWLLFRYPFHPRVTAVARKRSRSFCQKCRWQVTAKHAYILRMWLCLKWHGAWLYGVHRTCAATAAVSCGTSHASAVSTPLRWIINNNKKKKKKVLQS